MKTPNAAVREQFFLRFKNIPGEEFFPILRRGSKRRFLKKSRQIFSGNKAVPFGRLYKRVHAAGTFSPVRTLRKQPRAAPHHKRPYRVLASVVVRRKIRAFKIPNQLVPLPEAVAYRLSQKQRWRHFVCMV